MTPPLKKCPSNSTGVSNGGNPTLYDPGGSYLSSQRGSGDSFGDQQAALGPYINYQKQDGPSVQIYTFNTTPAQETAIVNNIDNMGGASPGYCASTVSNVLNGIGPFAKLGHYWTPSGLGSALQQLIRQRQGY